MSVIDGRRTFRDDPDRRTFEFHNSSTVQIPVRNGPISAMGINPDGSRLVVTNYGRNTVSVIDTDARRVAETIAGLDEPSAVVMSGAHPARAYISSASAAYDSIDVVDIATNTRIATHRLANSLTDLTVSADGRFLYVSRNAVRGADVAIVDTSTERFEVIELADAAGTTAECVCVSPDERQLYVASNGPSGGRLVVIETRARAGGCVGGSSRIVGAYELGLPIRDVALSSDGGTAYVASCGPVVGAVLDVIDTRARKITSTRKISEGAGILTRLTLSRDGRRAYLVSDDRILVVGTQTHEVVGEITAAKHPSCVVESPDGRYLYIADYSGVVIAAPLASGTGPGQAPAAGLPELPQREPAFA